MLGLRSLIPPPGGRQYRGNPRLAPYSQITPLERESGRCTRENGYSGASWNRKANLRQETAPATSESKRKIECRYIQRYSRMVKLFVTAKNCENTGVMAYDQNAHMESLSPTTKSKHIIASSKQYQYQHSSLRYITVPDQTDVY